MNSQHKLENHVICKEGYYFKDSECVECTANCKHCQEKDNISRCAICNDGYARNVDYSCVKCSLLIKNCEKCYFSEVRENYWVSSKLH